MEDGRGDEGHVLLTWRERVVAGLICASVVGTFLLHPKLPHAIRPADALLALSMLATVALLPGRIRVPGCMLAGFVLLGGAGTVSHFWTSAVAPVVTFVKTFWVWSWAVCLLVVARLPRGQRWLAASLAISAAIGALGIIWKESGGALGPLETLLREPRRPVGFYDNPNLAGSHLLVGVILIPLFIRRSIAGIGWLAAWAACIWALWMTQSLAALGGLLLALLAFLPMALWIGPFRARKWPLLLVGFAVVTVCWQVSLVRSRGRGSLAARRYRAFKFETKMASRGEIERNSFELWASAPFLGVGRGRAYQLGLHRGWAPGGGHNEFLTTLAEAGVVGFLGLMMLLGAPTVVGMKAVRWRGPLSPTVALCLCAFLGQLCIGWTHDIIHFRHLWALMAILLAARPDNRPK